MERPAFVDIGVHQDGLVHVSQLSDRFVRDPREAVKAGLAKSKFKNEAGFGDKIDGHILLTYHNDDCWYRNLKIRELK